MRQKPTGRRLHDPKGGSFWFDAGAVCLDFAHSGGEGQYAKFESLHRPGDLTAWLARPPLNLAATTPATEADLTAAKELRQAIWVIAHDRAAGRDLSEAAVATLNHAAAAPPLAPRLAGDHTTAEWAPPVLMTQALSTLARELIELLSGPLAERFRVCASHDCPLVFVDSSRPGARRWCSMERCGNRNKARAHRARHTPSP